MEASSFQFTFYGEGYTEEQDTSQEKPSAKIRTRVQGPGNLKLRAITMQQTLKSPWKQETWHRFSGVKGIQISPGSQPGLSLQSKSNPSNFSFCYSEAGYVATPIAMVQAALTLLNEAAALPKKWVNTPPHLPPDLDVTSHSITKHNIHPPNLPLQLIKFRVTGRGLSLYHLA